MRDAQTGPEEATGNIPETSPGVPQPAAGGDPSRNLGSAAATGTDLAELENRIKAAMRTVYDPEIPINIYELGLVYGLQIEPEGKVRVQMTLTAPSCPEAQTLPARVQQVIQEVPGVSETTVELVWEPTWTPQKMSEAARLQLGIF
jgi:FeS assembly SUF system protein